MEILYSSLFKKHATGEGHPENAKRLSCFEDLEDVSVPSGESFLELVHDPSYIDAIRFACADQRALDADTYVSKESYLVACHAVGATVQASKTSAFALVRPPGHHAHSAKAGGFCLFNNIAIAAKKLVLEGKKVLIFDFDGHHGDGTESIFYDSQNVLYWSLHQDRAFPYRGNEHDLGGGEGVGYTMNLPLPAGTGDDIYMNAFEQMLPVAEQFKPDVVAVSAGFDAHQSDPLLNLRLTLNTYYRLGKIMGERFKQIFAVLEGGYVPEVIAQGTYNFMEGVSGRPQRFKEPATDSTMQIHHEFDLKFGDLMNELSQYWKI